MREVGSDAGLSSSISNYPLCAWFFNAILISQKWDLQLPTVLLLLFFFPQTCFLCVSRMHVCLHPLCSLVLCCNFLLPGGLLWANNHVLFSCLVVMLLTYLERCLYIPSECCNILYTAVSYNILVCLYLDRRKAKINYILINSFLIHRCHMWLLWLWQICEKEGNNIHKVSGIYCFQRTDSLSLHFGHQQECCRQSLYCIGGDRDNTASSGTCLAGLLWA